jgi:serine/threonine protein phosphatase PrpC
MIAPDKQVAATRDAGETTLIALQAGGAMVAGASVGDSEAWVVNGADVRVLTVDQQRKPLVGSEATSPVAFAGELRGTLVVASDGLFRFATKGKIVETIGKVSLPDLPKSLVDLTRLRSGKLQDDVAVLVARMAS